MIDYLAETYYYDYSDEAVQRFVQSAKDLESEELKASRIYELVRDGFWYSPNKIHFSKAAYRASFVASLKQAHCIEKSLLLVACYRSIGLPSRIHLAKVINHIAVENLEKKFGIVELTPHGMVDVLVNGKWLKCSPAFNKELCEKCNVDALDFDGKEDSIFQQYDKAGNKFMDYIEDYGHFEDLPMEFIKQNFADHYPATKPFIEAESSIDLAAASENGF